MHLQPVFADAPRLVTGTAERLFERGVTLPSGSVHGRRRDRPRVRGLGRHRGVRRDDDPLGGHHRRPRLPGLAPRVPAPCRPRRRARCAWGARSSPTPSDCAAAVGGVDTVIHVAGVNRAGSDEEVEQGNLDLACTLADAIRASGRPVHVVYANSIQSDDDNAYGRGKAGRGGGARGGRARGRRLASPTCCSRTCSASTAGRAYNSFVATFADEVAAGREPTVTEDREIPLLHAQRRRRVPDRRGRAADLVGAPPGGRRRAASARCWDLLKDVPRAATASGARSRPLTDDFAVDLFNTYRARPVPAPVPDLPAGARGRPRGELFETVRAHGGTGQAFVSTTVPGAHPGRPLPPAQGRAVLRASRARPRSRCGGCCTTRS